MRRLLQAVAAVALIAVGCDEAPNSPELDESTARASAHAGGGPMAPSSGPFTFEDGPVFDIEAAPNGNILAVETVTPGIAIPPEGATSTSTLWEIRTQGPGGKRAVTTITTPQTVPVNGLASVGRGQLYAARGGLDQAFGAALLQVTPAGGQVVADIGAFEIAEDPDDAAISNMTDTWKDTECAAASGPFTPGPQSNPFRLEAASGNTMIVGDAAGNTVLRADRTGEVELVALFTPPADGAVASTDPDDWMEFPFPGATGDDCYVQPVPNTVTLGEDGAIYVGELTGIDFTAPPSFTPFGASRVWRIEPGAKNIVCPSPGKCEVVLDGFTSIIDLAFGPSGDLYVVEYDEAGWTTAFGFGSPVGGTVNRCDLDAASVDASVVCDKAVLGGETLENLVFPGAIAFDTRDVAWLLENNQGLPESFTGLAGPEVPTVRKLE